MGEKNGNKKPKIASKEKQTKGERKQAKHHLDKRTNGTKHGIRSIG